MTKLNPKYVLAALFAAMLSLGLLFRGCDPTPDISSDVAAVKSVVSRMRTDSIRLAYVIDSLKTENNFLQESKALAEQRASVASVRLKTTSESLASLRLEYNNARAERDTVKAFDRCDEMARHIGLLSGNVAALLSAVDSVNRLNDQIIANRDRVVAAQDSAIRSIRAGFSDIATRYGSLEKTYTKLAKKHKRERRNKFIGIAAAVVAGVVFKFALK